MNLETSLPAGLWEAVRANYEKRNFTGAILDSFYFLSELLRAKSGLEGDGQSLVGNALGGASPKIKLNRMQTDSETNVQRGVEMMLRGMYQAIRNPRSHEKVSDSEEDARVLISFVGYVVRQIDSAKSQFSRSDFVRRVLDPDFVPNNRYSDLLVAEIPARHRLDVFLDLFREVGRWMPANMRFFVASYLSSCSADDVSQIAQLLSDELLTSDDDRVVRHLLGSFPDEFWPHIHEAARLRIENKLVRSVREGRYDEDSQVCKSGGLGTWGTGIFPHMSLKKEMLSAIAGRIESSSKEERAYAFHFFAAHISKLTDQVPKRIALALKAHLRAGRVDVYDELLFQSWYPTEAWPDDLKEAYDRFVEADDSDDIPF